MPIYLVIEAGQAKTGKAQVYGMNYGLNTLTPRNLDFAIALDVGAGGASGGRQYPPITITKGIDPASISMFTSLPGNVLPAVNLKFFSPDPSGSGEFQNFYTIILSNAVIARRLRNIPPARKLEQYIPHELEEIEIKFQRIEFKGGVGKPTSQDWSASA